MPGTWRAFEAGFEGANSLSADFFDKAFTFHAAKPSNQQAYTVGGRSMSSPAQLLLPKRGTWVC